MKAIYKFPVKTAILMPIGARIVALQVQHNVPMLWAICDTSAPTEPRLFNVRGTGFEFDAADEGASERGKSLAARSSGICSR